jgi:malonyl CoA-acyl carrier protein transacylase/phosphopantetheinyl transferase
MPVKARSYHREWPAELCTFASSSREGMIEQLQDFARFLHPAPQVCLKDVAYTLNVTPVDSGCRLALVASTAAEAEERANSVVERLRERHCARISDPRGIYFCEKPLWAGGRCAFLFPGEGSQYAGMLSDICMWFPDARAWFDRMDRAFMDHPRGYTPSQFVFPIPNSQSQDLVSNRLWEADGAVEAVFAASQAMLAVLKSLGIQPDAVVGHSSGDYSALFASGVFRMEGELPFIQQAREFNRVYEEFLACGGVPEGVLLAVNSASTALLDTVIQQSSGLLHLALDNCPHQSILCGTAVSVKRAAEIIRDAGAICEKLPFARAYHTAAFDPVSERLYEILRNVELAEPEIPVYSCVTAEPYPADADQIRHLAAVQWSRPVRFRETIERMYESGIRIFAEVGPRNNLTAFVADTLRGQPHLAVASNTAERSGMVQLQHFVAQLFAAGVPMRLDEFYENRQPQIISFVQATKEPALQKKEAKLSLRLPSLRLSSETQTASVADATLSQVVSRSPGLGADPAPSPALLELSPRAKALEGFFQNTMRMLDAERDVMTQFLSARRDQRRSGQTASKHELSTPLEPASIPVSDLPFVRKIVSFVPGNEVKVLCEIDLDEDLFLRQHTLGGKISTFDDRLVGLPVIPLTVSMEILAEVASLLVPERVITGMKAVRASRWLIVEEASVLLEISGRSTGDGEIQVALVESRANGAECECAIDPAVVATVVFEKPAQRSNSSALELAEDRPSKWRAGKMYDGTGMFHGPLFQAVLAMDSTSPEGAQAAIVGCSTDGFFRTRAANQLIDPVTLDAMGQVVGYWVGDQFETGLSVFPCRLESLDLHRVPLRTDERGTCRVRVRSVDEQWMRSDIEVVAADGELIARMIGWEDRRLDLPRRFYDFRIAPHDVFLSEPWTVPIEMATCRGAMLDRLPDGVLESPGSIWLLVLAYMVLNANEREYWRTLKSSGRKRLEWLEGRIVAKDAVRRLVRETEGLVLCPADIEITVNSSGAPEVRGQWSKDVRSVPTVSISHTNGISIAVACANSKGTAIGADIEQIGRMTEEVEGLVLSAGEKELLFAMDKTTRAEWATRLWCAKEAVGKALGRGVVPGSSELQVNSLDLQSGRVNVRVTEGIPSGPRPVGGNITAYTGSKGVHAFGTALL